MSEQKLPVPSQTRALSCHSEKNDELVTRGLRDLRKIEPDLETWFEHGNTACLSEKWEEAIYWYKRAAEHGHTKSQNALGRLCENGKGDQQSDELAIFWYEKAAVKNLADACYNLAWMYGKDEIHYKCECKCGKRLAHPGLSGRCIKCGASTGKTIVSKERRVHIVLTAPVVNTIYLNSNPSQLSLILDISSQDLRNVIYFCRYIVYQPGKSGIKLGQILSEEEYLSALEEHGDSFRAAMGAEGILELLLRLDISYEIYTLKSALDSDISEAKQRKGVRRLKLLESFNASAIKPEVMIADALSLAPSEIRESSLPTEELFVNFDLHHRLVNRNNRLKRLIELQAPEIIIRVEKRMLQEAVDDLLRAEACYSVANLKAGRDDEKMVFWLRKAAERGHPDAQCCLGWFYKSQSIPSSDDTNFWYQQAAQNNNLVAQHSLSLYLEDDERV